MKSASFGKMDELVSIIVPVHNAENFIRDTIDCVRGQSYEAWELLLIEDGSTDHTMNVMGAYLEDVQDRRIRLVKREIRTPQERSFGAARARNMGLSMAQTYDPQYNTQMTITSGMFYTFLVLLFLAGDGHVRLMALIYHSARLIPFGEVMIRPELSTLMVEIFKTSIATGLQLAFPILAMELVTESAVGILMRIIPQINVFAVNFQLKIIVGLMMLLYMFSPIASKMYTIIDNLFLYIEEALRLMV